MKNKLVSIILPTYNGERFIRESLDSTLAQTYQNWEMIIVNDCSKDNTLLIANEYAQKDKRIRVISNKHNLKLPASLNIGFREAKGEYYTWTSDDNMFKPEAIEYMVNCLEENSEIDLVSCNCDYIREDGSLIQVYFNYDRQMSDLAQHNNIGACFMYTSDIAKKIGEYNNNMFCAEDYEYWCRIAVAGRVKYLDKNLYLYRNNSQSLTAVRQKTVQKRIMEIRFKFAEKIMNKLNITKEEKMLQYINFYNENNNTVWLIKAFLVNPSSFIAELVSKLRLLFKIL